MDNKALEQSIIKTLAYFDLSDYPLTQEELFDYLWQPPPAGYEDLVNFLANYSGDKFISKFGYHFLPHREEIIERRQRAAVFSDLKMKTARRGAKLIRAVPFLRAVFVCNTVGAGTAKSDSDIDFFIIAEKNRIWLTRLLVAGWLSLFGLRRSDNRIHNKICLSFYVTTDNLDLSPYRVADADIHFAYWLNQMVPLYDPQNLWGKFLHINNWIKKFLPNLYQRPALNCLNSVADTRWSLWWKKIWERMWQGTYGNIINDQAKEIQRAKMKYFAKRIERVGEKGVIIGDKILKFHEHDTRVAVRQHWHERVDNLMR